MDIEVRFDLFKLLYRRLTTLFHSSFGALACLLLFLIHKWKASKEVLNRIRGPPSESLLIGSLVRPSPHLVASPKVDDSSNMEGPKDGQPLGGTKNTGTLSASRVSCRCAALFPPWSAAVHTFKLLARPTPHFRPHSHCPHLCLGALHLGT